MSARWNNTYEDELDYINACLSNSQRVNRFEDTIYTREAITRIGDEMDRLKQQYTFTHQFLKPQEMDDDSEYVRSVRRLVKLRFRCKNPQCKQFKIRENKDQKASELERHWTSYNGLVDFRFSYETKFEKKKLIPHLIYSLTIYQQKCNTCKKWGKSGLISSILESLIDLYSLLIQNLLINQRKNKEASWTMKEKVGIEPKQERIGNSSHLSELCQACQKGVCIRFYRVKLEEEVKLEANSVKMEAEDQPEWIDKTPNRRKR